MLNKNNVSYPLFEKEGRAGSLLGGDGALAPYRFVFEKMKTGHQETDTHKIGHNYSSVSLCKHSPNHFQASGAFLYLAVDLFI